MATVHIGTTDVATSTKNGLMSAADKAKLDSLSSGTMDVATEASNGLMSAADKAKLEGIQAEANKYVHPTNAGNKHIPAGGASGNVLKWQENGTAVWGNIANATASANGLMSSTDKGKLDNITKPATTGYVIQKDANGYYIEV